MKKVVKKLLNIILPRFKNLGIYNEKLIKKKHYNEESEKKVLENEELTKYINKIVEQQEKERIVRWLVNSIRESLDLDKVLGTTVEEIGKLLSVDSCLIALYEQSEQKFNCRSEYRKNENNSSIIYDEKICCISRICNLPDKWFEILVRDFCPIVVNNIKKDKLGREQIEYMEENDIKSLIIIPVVHNEKILGMIMVSQLKYPRQWEESHLELLMDTGGQIAIAIGQAILYTKIQETTRLKSEFLAGMSHELRTPLNAIIGFSEMLISENYGQLNEKQKKFVNNISVSGEHLLRLVNDILDLSKIESGKFELQYETFNIFHSVRETVSVLNSLTIKKNIKIKMDVKNEIFINADLRRFKQIMYNLLSNAIKFTQENGEVLIKASEENDNLKIEIYDDGIGISDQDRDKLFKTFSQVDFSLTRKQEGTGLGLALTKKLIELHKGEINFESEKGKGSKFWFILPKFKLQKTLNFEKDSAFN